VYNKTLEEIKNGHPINQIKLRDILVTNNTKKNHPEYVQKSNEILSLHQELKQYKIDNDTIKIAQYKNLIILENKKLRKLAKTLIFEKNENIQSWELDTPKEIRADTVRDVCKAYKSAFSNYGKGKIKNFNISYRKKDKKEQCISLQENLVSIEENQIKIAPSFFEVQSKFNVGKKIRKELGNIFIDGACRLTKQQNKYNLYIPVKYAIKKNDIKEEEEEIRYCGLDPGVRTFLTSFNGTHTIEYDFRMSLLDKLNKKIKDLKGHGTRPRNQSYKRLKKKVFYKIENKKSNYIDELHWSSIKHLLENNDVIFFGDIKSHNIV